MKKAIIFLLVILPNIAFSTVCNDKLELCEDKMKILEGIYKMQNKFVKVRRAIEKNPVKMTEETKERLGEQLAIILAIQTEGVEKCTLLIEYVLETQNRSTDEFGALLYSTIKTMDKMEHELKRLPEFCNGCKV